ncbi:MULTISPECIES: helicase C-terminal domain-containing protein [unclassified Streptococcus]|uniref:helicase C-terminal domain-containing protein n=1 Tax=unclassified Streptococcus TaxID=2608887 RepID=UPI0018AB6213|nr:MULTISPECIES: helicase C-terminal domain-containing protein [unclassified Streptococcus]MBF8970608.1 DEAD/DEAH box helicase [Streptococcus sp. NLN76]MBG9366973.1 DEAD/DEAH box helicase [Streptococcus sp. NLN64]
MNQKYAIVDIEATNPGNQAKIIQVGIVLLENGEIVQSYQTDVNPQEVLDQHIIELTGITDQQLAQAPLFSQVAGVIYDLLEDAVFVAHNVTFDANLLAEALFWEGYELRTPRVDTVELAQVCFPRFQHYSLGSLCQELEIPLENAHTALADAQATAELLLVLMERIQGLPKGLVEQLWKKSDALLYETGLIFQDCLGQMEETSDSAILLEHGLYVRKPVRSARGEVSLGDWQENFRRIGLEARPAQAALANYIHETKGQKGVSVLQAEVGSGKTWAYLLGLLQDLNQGRRLLVSVPTKILMQQLLEQEGELLSQTFGLELLGVKSPRNFLSLDALHAYLKKADWTKRSIGRFLMQLLVWLAETETGDLDEIGQAYRLEHILKDLRHQGQLGERSLFPTLDFWRRLEGQMGGCPILVTNHAFLPSLLESYPALFSDTYLVLDEAQSLLRGLEEANTLKIPYLELAQKLQDVVATEKEPKRMKFLQELQVELEVWKARQAGKNYLELEQGSLANIQGLLRRLGLERLPDSFRFFFEEGVDFYLRGRKNQEELVAVGGDYFQLGQGIEVCRHTYLISASLDQSLARSLLRLAGVEEVDVASFPGPKLGRQLVLTSSEFPDVSLMNFSAYANFVGAWIENLYPMGHPMMVVFSSRELLNRVAGTLSVPCLTQVEGQDNQVLRKRFERGDHQVLLALGSFWEGVDLKKLDQVIQVIVRLPFANPKNILVDKLSQSLAAEGLKPFDDFILPLAGQRLQQIMGRIRRRENQLSAVLILDGRLARKVYGQDLQEELRKAGELLIRPQDLIPYEIANFFERYEES